MNMTHNISCKTILTEKDISSDSDIYEVEGVEIFWHMEIEYSDSSIGGVHILVDKIILEVFDTKKKEYYKEKLVWNYAMLPPHGCRWEWKWKNADIQDLHNLGIDEMRVSFNKNKITLITD